MTSPSTPLTVRSLFTGVGGIDLACERAGMTIIDQCEVDPHCRTVLRHHWPDVTICEDVKELDGSRLQRTDVLVGGFPCQDVSVAGNRAGLAGSRTGLYWELHRVLAETLPQWFVLENVPGLLSSNGGRDFGAILGSLVELGYGVAWRVLDAKHFGVPQRRRRVFIVGCLANWFAARRVLFEPESSAGDIAAGGNKGESIARTLTAGVASGRGVNPPGRRQEDDYNLVVDFRSGSIGPGPVGTLQAHHQSYSVNAMPHVVVNALTANGVGTCGADDNQGQAGHLIPVYDPAPTLTRRYGKGAGSDADDALVLSASDSAPLPYGFHSLQDPYGAVDSALTIGVNGDMCVAYPLALRGRADGVEMEMGEEGTYNALRAGDGSSSRQPLIAYGYPAIRQGMQVRRLTPLECERLQGMPDNWTDVPFSAPTKKNPGRIKRMPNSHRYRMCGNGVAVPCVEWVMRRLVEVDAKINPVRESVAA